MLPAAYAPHNVIPIPALRSVRQDGLILIGCEMDGPLQVGAVVEFGDEWKTRGIIVRAVQFTEYAEWASRHWPGITMFQLFPKAFEVLCD